MQKIQVIKRFIQNEDIRNADMSKLCENGGIHSVCSEAKQFIMIAQLGIKLITILVVLMSLRAGAQGIELIRDFEVINEICFPLKDYDKGISFQYVTQMGARVKSYLRIGSESRLMADNIEIKGLSILSIPPARLREWFDYPGNFRSELVFYLETLRTKRYSERRYPLSFTVDAPYGITELQKPTKPDLLSTNVRIKTTNGLAVGGLIVSAGMIIGGIKLENGSEIEIDGPLFYGALILGALSLAHLNSWELDKETNERNRITNNQLEWQYQQEQERISRINQQIRESFRITVRVMR